MYYEETLPYYDCGDDTPPCRSGRQTRLTILRLWRRHTLVSSEPLGSIVSALYVNC